jgi:hypothetical protein
VWTPLNLKNILFQNMYIENIKPKTEMRTQLIRKVNWAQSSIKRRPIPPKDHRYAPHLEIKLHPKMCGKVLKAH